MITPGTLLLHLYHQPVARIRHSLVNGGPWGQWRTEHCRREMEAAAGLLPALPAGPGGDPVTLHLMTGRRFWYQTLFCLHSFARASGRSLRAELYDDGTIDDACAERLAGLGGEVRLHRFPELQANLDRWLPAGKYPALRERWLHYPNLRKLTDVHLGGSGWKLVLDSDMLFFRNPELVLGWMGSPDRPLHAVDCTESYGYSRPLMEELAGARIPPLVNVGLCGLRSDALDWAEIETWCAGLIQRERTNYFLEQALVAMLAARAGTCAVAPAADYVTRPSRAEVLEPSAVMHHYVADSKRWYFRHGWRLAVP